MVGHDIILIGGSAGALQPLIEIVGGLPVDFPASVFVVIHSSPEHHSYLPEILGRAGALPVGLASNGESIVSGRICIARPDHHLLLAAGVVRVTRGPKENRFRPAVDPLFRSAALSYGPRAVGVVLSGGLDDGSAGLWAIKARGGIAIVQDPAEALAPSMPRSALSMIRVDHRLSQAEMAPVLVRLASEPASEPSDAPFPEDLEIETRIAMEDKALEAGVERLGEPSIFVCPECHGGLLRLKADGLIRFRCHTGHAYTADSLLSEMTEFVEGTLWNAVRSIQESSLLMQHIAVHARGAGDERLAAQYEQKAAEASRRAEEVRKVVWEHEPLSEDDLTREAN